MRKIVLVLAVLLLALPASAAVEVSCTVSDNNTVTISYTTDDGNDFRAFGLEVSVNNGAVISSIDVNDYDYYVFPGSIDINSNGDVDGWGQAVVDFNDDPNSSFILEMGSLYADDDPCHPIDPCNSGTLCTFKVSKECCVTLSENAARGGVVMENGDSYASVSGVCVTYWECYPLGMADWSTWDSVGRPPGWCNERQCHGDADGLAQGSTKVGLYYVGTDDLAVLLEAWEVNEPPLGPGIASIVKNGVPGINADFDHATQGSTKVGLYHVGTDDLAILLNYWEVNEAPLGPNTPNDCIDY
jgi:hypothetical protein